MNIDFEGLGARLLSNAAELLPAWLPGGKWRSAEWVCGSVRGGEGESFSANKNTGFWAEFGSGGGEKGTRGGDLISLYAAIHNLSQGDAAKELGGDGYRDAPPPTTIHKPPPVVEFPAVAAPVDHPSVPDLNGLAPSATYAYFGPDAPGPLFIVARFDPPGADKEIRPFTWRSNRNGEMGWSFKHYPAPRPLYRLPELLAAAALPVLICEGEKSVDAAREALGASYCVTTWSGGSNAAGKTDFGALADRDVVIWPDADEPGRKAAALIAGKIGAKVRTLAIVNVPAEMPEGWDIADALRDGMTPTQVEAFIAQYLKVLKALPEPEPEPEPEEERPPDEEEYPVAEGKGSVYVSWKAMGLELNENGLAHATISNASLIVQRHPDLAGHIWYDTFARRMFHDFEGDPAIWTDADDIALTVKIQQQLRLNKFNLSTVRDGIAHAARVNRRNGLTQWLDSLIWDGTVRENDWLADGLGVAKTEYSMAVARNWPRSMIARAYKPGCQVDTVPVLEGIQGRGKSSFLNILGDPWYASITTAFGGEEFLKQIQGKWLIEVPDMSGFSKREHTHILGVVATRTDRYRDSYGRHAEDRPRSTVFAATSENDNYLKDIRGRRRWWPLACTHLDLDYLRGMREQIFAEAIVKYRAGSSWYEMPEEETNTEQLARKEPDLWTAAIMWQVNEWITGGYTDKLNSASILERALEMPVKVQTDVEKARVYTIMTENGFVQKVRKVGGLSARIWVRAEPDSYVTRRLNDAKGQGSGPALP